MQKHWCTSNTQPTDMANKTSVILKPFDISMQQYNILRILRGAKDPIPVQIVKDRMVEKSPNTTRLVDKLCLKDFVCRHRCENDRRVVYIGITKLGLSLLEAIPVHEIERLMDPLTAQEAKQLNFLLDKLH
jgi:DNA-binding MarR family transcriptional regulator